MQAFAISILAAVVVAIGAYYVLNRYQEPVSVAYTTNAVRL
jgi:hypothetical protein